MLHIRTALVRNSSSRALKKLDIGKLADSDVRERYCSAANELLETPRHTGDSVESLWATINNAITVAVDEVVGTKPTTRSQGVVI